MTQIINNKVNTKIKEFIKKDNFEHLDIYLKSLYPNLTLDQIINKDKENLLHLSIFFESNNITQKLIESYPGLLYEKNVLGKNPFFSSLSTHTNQVQFVIDTVRQYHASSFDNWITYNLNDVDGNEETLLYNTISHSNKETFDIIKTQFLSNLDGYQYQTYLNQHNTREHTLAHIIVEKKADYAYDLLAQMSSKALNQKNFKFLYNPAMLSVQYDNQEGLEALYKVSSSTWQGMSHYGDTVASIAVYKNNMPMLEYILNQEPQLAFEKGYKKSNLFYKALSFENEEIALKVFEHYKNHGELKLFNPSVENGTYDNFLVACHKAQEHPQVFSAYINYLKNNPEIIQSYNFGDNEASLEDNEIKVTYSPNQTYNNSSNEEKQEAYRTKDPLSIVLEKGTIEQVKLLLDAGFTENKLPSAFRDYFNVAATSSEAKEKIQLLLEYKFNIVTFNSNLKTVKEIMPKGQYYREEENHYNVLRIQVHNGGQIFDTIKDYFLPSLVQAKLTDNEFFDILKNNHFDFSYKDYYLALFPAIEAKKHQLVDYFLKQIQLSFNEESRNAYSEQEALKHVHEYMLSNTDFKNSKYLKFSYISQLRNNDLEQQKETLNTLYSLFYNGVDDTKINKFHFSNNLFLNKKIKNKDFLGLLFKQAQLLLNDEQNINNLNKIVLNCFKQLDHTLFNQVFNDNKFQFQFNFDSQFFTNALSNLSLFEGTKPISYDELNSFFKKIDNPTFEKVLSKCLLKSILLHRNYAHQWDNVEIDKIAHSIIKKLNLEELIDIVVKKDEQNQHQFSSNDLRQLELNNYNYHVVEHYFQTILPYIQHSEEYKNLDYNILYSSIMSIDKSFLSILNKNIEQIYNKIDLAKIAFNFISHDAASQQVSIESIDNKKYNIKEATQDTQFLISLIKNFDLTQDNVLVAPTLREDSLIDIALAEDKLYLVKAMLSYLKENHINQYESYCNSNSNEWSSYLIDLVRNSNPEQYTTALAQIYFNLSTEHGLFTDGKYRGQNILQLISAELPLHHAHKDSGLYHKAFCILNQVSNKFEHILEDFVNQPYFMKDLSSILLHYTQYMHLEGGYGFNVDMGKNMSQNILEFLDNVFQKLDKNRFDKIYHKLNTDIDEKDEDKKPITQDAKEKMSALFEKHKMDKVFMTQDNEIKPVVQKKMKI